MEENQIIESNGLEEVVTPQIEEQQQTEEIQAIEPGVNEEITEPQEIVEEQPQQQVQSPEMNAQFAKLRRESEQRGMDKAIEMLGLTFNDKPIKTYADYQEAQRQQKLYEEAQRQGIDPEFYTKFADMETKLTSYEREKSFMEQDRELSNDEDRSGLYAECKDEVKAMSEQYGVDLRTAFTLYVENNIGKITRSIIQKAQNEAIANINKNKNSSPGALSNPSEQPILDYGKMSSEEFAKIRQKALNGELL